MIKKLFLALSQTQYVYINETDPSRKDYHGYSYSDVATTSKGDCIIMKEFNGCLINLKNLDERSSIQRYTYTWTFFEEVLKFERANRKETEKVLEMQYIDGKLVDITSLECGNKVNAEVTMVGDTVEVMMLKGFGDDVRQTVIEFRKNRRP